MRHYQKPSALLLLTLLLCACSMVRIGYNQAQTVSFWWLDSYFNFIGNQEAQVKNDLGEIHQWHRTSQLPEYVQLLAAIGNKTPGDVSPASVCEDIDAVRAKLVVLANHTAPYLARLARQLNPAQIDHLRDTFAEKDRAWREKWIEPTPEELAVARYDAWLDRAETFYGDITPEQQAFMKNAIARSALNVQISWEHRQQRQKDIVATFGKIVASRASQSAAEGEIRALLDRSLNPKDPVYREMLQKLLDEACINLAGLHQLTSREQRLRAQKKLRSYERDLRLLN